MINYLEEEVEINNYTFSEIKKSFDFHYNNCNSYKDFCDLHEYTPDQLNDYEDLCKIPQIPTSIFKSIDVCSVDTQSCKCCKSSGTKGLVSKIYRDKSSIQAFIEGILRDVKQLYDIDPEKTVVYNLGPALEEAGEVWFAYITSFLQNAVETCHFMKAGILQTDLLVEKLINFGSEKRVVLLGTPALFVKVFSDMEVAGVQLTLPEDAILITAGGWKSKHGDTMSREALCELIKKNFGMEDSQIFDAYNQVECNTAFFECRCHHKHVPAGVAIIIRDGKTFEKVEEGKEGVVTFLDSHAHSYPAFVITDDIGYVTNGCECGYKGQVFHYVRRVKTVETKGCAMKMDQIAK